MIVLHGVTVSEGVATGPAFVFDDIRIERRSIKVDEVEAETAVLENALGKARMEVDSMRANDRMTTNYAQFLDSARQLLDDASLVDEIREHIAARKTTADNAVVRAFRHKMKEISSPGTEAPRRPDRAVSIAQSQILISLSALRRPDLSAVDTKVVLIARDLSADQTASLDTSKVAGIATDFADGKSPAAALARSLGIPAIVGLGNVTERARTGDLVIVVAPGRKVIISPDKATLADYRP